MVMNTFKTEFQNFSEKWSFTQKNLILRGFGGTLPAHTLQPWPLGLWQI